MQTETIIEVKKTLVKFGNEAIQFFTDAAEIIKQKEQDHGGYEKGFRYTRGYWSCLPLKLQEESHKITEDIIESIKAITPAVKMSPLLTEADERDLSLSVKTIRAALHLREFHFRDIEILHDEDIILGIQPATQSDEREQAPNSAQYDFDKALEKILSIIDLTTASDSELQKKFLINTPGVSGYKQNTAFIMMWMDNTRPELTDVSD
jgi:hypothetical protein